MKNALAIIVVLVALIAPSFAQEAPSEPPPTSETEQGVPEEHHYLVDPYVELVIFIGLDTFEARELIVSALRKECEVKHNLASKHKTVCHVSVTTYSGICYGDCKERGELPSPKEEPPPMCVPPPPTNESTAALRGWRFLFQKERAASELNRARTLW